MCKKGIKKMLAMIVAFCLVVSMMPWNALVAIAETTTGSSQTSKLDAAKAEAKAYIDALMSKNDPSTVVTDNSKFFTWDNEKRSPSNKDYLYEWSYYNGVVFEGLDYVYGADNTSEKEKYKAYVDEYLSSMITDGKLNDYAGYVNYHGADCYKTASLLLDYGYTDVAATLYQDLQDAQTKNYTSKDIGGNYYHTWSSKPEYAVWLDGLYMTQPFMAEYAKYKGDTAELNKIADRFTWVSKNMYDSSTGLFYHMANSSSAYYNNNDQYWGRAIGWYAAAMVDVMDDMSGDNLKAMKSQFKTLVDGMVKYQTSDGMWCQFVNVGYKEENPLKETSVTALMAYAIQKAVNQGWLESSYAQYAQNAFIGMCNYSLKDDGLHYICEKGGYDYYAEPTSVDEGKGVGPFIMAYAEMLKATDVTDNIDSSTGDQNASENTPSSGDSSTESETSLNWVDVSSEGTETTYEQVQSMDSSHTGGYVIFRSSNGALTYNDKSDVTASNTITSMPSDSASITENNIWYIDTSEHIYCINNGKKYYIKENGNAAALTTKSSDATEWELIKAGNDVRIKIKDTNKYLRYNSNDFIIQKGDSYTGLCLYKRIPGTPSVSGQATLSGTLSYTIRVGESLTEDQIKSAARVLYRSNETVTTPDTIPWNNSSVTYSWDDALDTNTVGVYIMNVYYNGIKIGEITVDVVLNKNTDNWGLPVTPETEYPEYPNDGAVRIKKSASEVDFKNTGIAKVELDVAGISNKKAVDVVLVVDVSNSMAWSLENGGQSQDEDRQPTGTQKSKMELTMESCKEFADILLAPNEDGTASDNSITFVTFGGFDKEYSGTPDKYFDSTRTWLTGSKDINEIKNMFNSVSIRRDMSVNSNYKISINGESGGNFGNTNYDYAFSETAKAIDNLQGSSYAESGRETYVVFMTDGAPSNYNDGYYTTGRSENYKVGSDVVYDDKGSNNADTWYNYITSKENKYARTVYNKVGGNFTTVGFGLQHGGFGSIKWDDENKLPDFLKMMIRDKNGNALNPVVSATNARQLKEFYKKTAQSIKYAGTEAEVTDIVDSTFTLQMGSTVGNGTEKYPNGYPIINSGITPTIEVLAYDLWTKAETSDSKLIGTRKDTDPSVIEKVTFNDTGTEAYSNKKDGNIMTTNENGVITILGKYFTYTKDANGKETFKWNIGTITDKEIALTYYAYLKGAIEGKADPGIYYTNESAILQYVDVNGQYAQKVFPRPAVAWEGAITTFEYYLVNEKGEPVNHAGEVVPIANKIVIGEQHSVLLNQNANDEVSAQIEAQKYLPTDYTLYDVNASYYVQTSSGESVQAYHTISQPSADASSIKNGKQQTGAQTTLLLDHTDNYIQSHFAFGVRYDCTPVQADLTLNPNEIVIDYGKAVQVDVLEKADLDAIKTYNENASGEIVGFVAFNKDTDTSYIQFSAGSPTYTSTNGEYSIVDGKVKFKLNKLLSEVEKVFVVTKISVNKTDGTNDSFYLYQELDIIPATMMYYETDFADGVFTFTEPTSGAWINKTDRLTADGLQDDGTIGAKPLQTYGYDSTYTNDKYLSNSSSYYVEGQGRTKTYVDFSFTGTGFDLISRTGTQQGAIRVDIYSDSQMQNRVKSVTVLNKSESSLELYQIPVVSVNGLGYGTYYVRIGVNAASPEDAALVLGNQFYFDAIRIYDPINTSSTSEDANTAKTAYSDDGEYGNNITEVRSMLLDSKTYDSSATSETSQTGVLFVDRTKDAVSIGTYSTIGPNNEVYLSPGQAITFKISSDSIPSSIDIGAKSADGESVPLSVTIANDKDEKATATNIFAKNIETSTSLYYDILSGKNASEYFSSGYAYVTITNPLSNTNTDSILSITDIKVAYNSTASATSTANFFVDNDTLSFAAFSLTRPEVAEPDYDIKSAEFTSSSCNLFKKATMIVVTTTDVEELKVTNKYGTKMSTEVTSTVNEEGMKVWTVKFRPLLLGTQSFTVTGYGADGTEGASATASIKVKLF